MNVWKLMLHHEKEQYDPQVLLDIRNNMLNWTIHEGRIALGWGEVSNVPECNSPEDCAQAIRDVPVYRDKLPVKNIERGGYSLYNFCHVMQNGDKVILVGKNSRRELVMQIGDENGRHGEYFREPTEQPAPVGDYQHQRRAHQIGDHNEADQLWVSWKDAWKKQAWKQAGGSIEGIDQYCTLMRLIIFK